MDADQYDSAITNLTKALTIDPTYFDAYVNRGLVFAILGQYDQAIADENKAIELAPNDAYGYGSLALILVSCPSEQYQDNAKALQLALKAVSLSPDDYESLDSLACAYAANGDFKNAIATGQQAITLCPDGEKRDVYQQQIAGFEQGKNIWQQ
jgi:tetratricopeptide (TPR) repeat protein